MTTISKINHEEIPQLIELLNSEGVDTFAMETFGLDLNTEVRPNNRHFD